MKALTVYPEWAHAIAHLGKRVENRTWACPASVIGTRIAIHAGAHIGGRKGKPARLEAIEAVDKMSPTALSWWRWPGGTLWVRKHKREYREVICGAIVATAVVRSSGWYGSRDDMRLAPPWAVVGAHWWHLAEVEVLPAPIPCRGSLGLWTAPEVSP